MEAMYDPHQWREVYTILGTGAAALSGLIIVAASVRADQIMSAPHWRLLARNSTIGMITLMMASILIVIPQPIAALGVELMVFNLGCAIILPAHVIVHVRRQHAKLLLPPATAICIYLLAAAGGLSLLLQKGGGLYLTTLAYLAYFPHGVVNAYRLLVPGK